MEQDQENKVDEERLSREIASAFLERLYRHVIVNCHEGDAPFIRSQSSHCENPLFVEHS